MSLEEEFQNAVQRVKSLPSQSNENLLEMYGLYKQSTAGDVAGKRPGMLDMAGRAKYDAWAKLTGKSKDDAMRAYAALVAKLAGE